VVVGAEHEHEVLERDDDDQCPEDERQNTKHVTRRRRHGVRAVEAFANGVEGAGADVAVDNPKGDEEQRGAIAPPSERSRRGHRTGLAEGARQAAALVGQVCASVNADGVS
jgi:hypothetical protein